MATNDDVDDTIDSDTDPEHEGLESDQENETPSEDGVVDRLKQEGVAQIKNRAANAIRPSTASLAKTGLSNGVQAAGSAAGGQVAATAARSALVAAGPEILAGVLILIAILTSVLAFAFVICSYQGCNGKNAGDAKNQIGNVSDNKTLRKVICLGTVRPDLEKNPDARLPDECIKLNTEASNDAIKSIDNLKSTYDKSTNVNKDKILELLSKIKTEYQGVLSAGGKYKETQQHATAIVDLQQQLDKLLPNSVIGSCSENFGKIVDTGRTGDLAFPVAGKATSGAYAGDDGLDIKADFGTPVVAVTDGTLRYVSTDGSHIAKPWNSPQGGIGPNDPPNTINTIGINLANGNYAFYAHLSDVDPSLKGGSAVKKGQVIGCMGRANKVSHLHIGIYANGTPTDPFSLEAKWF